MYRLHCYFSTMSCILNDLKDKIWDERLEQWFDGKDDPNLTVLEIEPSEIRLMNEGESTPVTLDM